MKWSHYIRRVWLYLYFIIFIVAVSAAVAFVISNNDETVYTAEARMVVTAGLGTDANGADNVLTAPRIGQTYAVLATTRPVLDNVIKRADLPYDRPSSTAPSISMLGSMPPTRRSSRTTTTSRS